MVLAAILYLNEKDAPAGLFFGLGEAIIVGGLGLVVGEKIGAESAAKELTL